MKIRSFTRPNQAARSLVREGNVVTVWVDQGKSWHRHEVKEFPTVSAAKYFMNRPIA
jgi:hypothetical protein